MLKTPPAPFPSREAPLCCMISDSGTTFPSRCQWFSSPRALRWCPLLLAAAGLMVTTNQYDLHGQQSTQQLVGRLCLVLTAFFCNYSGIANLSIDPGPRSDPSDCLRSFSQGFGDCDFAMISVCSLWCQVMRAYCACWQVHRRQQQRSCDSPP